MIMFVQSTFLLIITSKVRSCLNQDLSLILATVDSFGTKGDISVSRHNDNKIIMLMIMTVDEL